MDKMDGMVRRGKRGRGEEGKRKLLTGLFFDRTIEEWEMRLIATMPCCALSSTENVLKRTTLSKRVA